MFNINCFQKRALCRPSASTMSTFRPLCDLASNRRSWEPRFTNRAPSPPRTPTNSVSSLANTPRSTLLSPGSACSDCASSQGEVISLLKELQQQVRGLQEQSSSSGSCGNRATRQRVPRKLAVSFFFTNNMAHYNMCSFFCSLLFAIW